MDRRAALLALALVLAPGCRSDGGAAEGGGGGAAAAASPLGQADLDPAVHAFTAKVAAQDAKGWPAGVARDGARPTVHLEERENRTRRWIDLKSLREQLSRALVAQGLVVPVEGGDAGLVLEGMIGEQTLGSPTPETHYTVSFKLLGAADRITLVQTATEVTKVDEGR
jgi:hypothetical protein